MKLNSKKLQTKIDLLTRKLNQKNQELYKEKKAVNTLLAQPVADNKKLLDASMEKIKEAEYAKRQDIVEEIKIEQESKAVQLIRNERIKCFKRIASVKEKVLEEKNANKKLLATIRVMQNQESALSNEFNLTTIKLSKEMERTVELRLHLERDRQKLHDEKQKRYHSVHKKDKEIEWKDKEISKLTKSLFEITDEIKQTEK